MRIGFGIKLVIVFVLMLFCISTGIGLYALNTMDQYGVSLLENRLLENVNLTYQLLEQTYPGEWRNEGGILYKGDIEITSDSVIMDTISKSTGNEFLVYLGTEMIASDMEDISNPEKYRVSPEVLSDMQQEGKVCVKKINIAGIKQFAGIVPIKDQFSDIIGFLAIRVPQKEFIGLVKSVRIRMMIGAYLAMLGTAIVFYFLTRIISRPIPKLVEGMTRAESGNLTTRLNIDTYDEFADLGDNYNSMVTNIAELIRKIQNASEQVSNMADMLNNGAAESSKTTEQIAATIHMVATGTEDQAKSVEQTSIVIGEMSKGIQDVAGHAHDVMSISKEASSIACKGGSTIQNAVSQMKNINVKVNSAAASVTNLGKKSKMIGYIVDVITGIAKQTNLLALNAAIEAARAGEQGRGFAVVAEEVRKLAEQSGQAAKEISDLIIEIQEETGNVVEAMEKGIMEVESGTSIVDRAGEAFNDIVNSINTVNRRTLEVSAAAEEIAAGAEQAVASMQNIASISEETAASAEQVAAAAEEQTASIEEVAALASTLVKLSEELKSMVENFRV
ncbi:methyl-accepting chemotaxis protein [Phosphitispora sp. TUW77]|uniref:methyl-accepting chemotaxis protein n=1 Tax=Phosphitispora sp. TUW77 TaxID=3152361 RepID=UPI003AB65E06